jgi:superfamily I DNA/RNA helicase
MDKKVIFAVAGSGKTTYIVNSLTADKRSLIITFTNNNHENLRRKIAAKFDGVCPENITLMTYFTFLYSFCFKPFLADKVGARGQLFNQKIINEEQARKRGRVGFNQESFYLTRDRYFYSNRLALYIEKNLMQDVKKRIERYFDEFIIDEVQDIAGRDFNFLECLMETNVDMLFVGDFYQHTFDTSRDGNVNASLFDDKSAYEARFMNKGLLLDNSTLIKSYRCSGNVCDYINESLGIEISSHRSQSDNTSIEYANDSGQISEILYNESIVKLHYDNASKYGSGHRNWGASKGEDKYTDVCVILYKTASAKRIKGKLNSLAASSKNKLYVAITRARGNVYLVDDEHLNMLSQ